MSDKFNVDDIEKEEQVPPEEKFEAKEIEINYWRTPLHGAKIGIKKEAVRAAQSRQFTKEMDVWGDITFKEKERKEVIGLNTGFFDLDDDSPLAKKYGNDADKNRRIVIKTFTELTETGGGRWTGTIEQSLAESLVLSAGERDPLPAFIVGIPGFDYLTRVVRSHTMTGARYVFALIDEKTNETRIFEISAARMALGSDFKVKDVGTGKKVADIDGKLLDVGGRWTIKLRDKELYDNTVFRRILILFSSAAKWLPEANETLNKLLKAIKGGYKFTPTGNELSVFFNPRRYRR
ncbi:MAG: hypothetical protein ACFFCD_13620 [Promethearchaeota archaeon]